MQASQGALFCTENINTLYLVEKFNKRQSTDRRFISVPCCCCFSQSNKIDMEKIRCKTLVNKHNPPCEGNTRLHVGLDRSAGSVGIELEEVPAQRTGGVVGGGEPLVQAGRMELLFASPAK